MDDKNDFGEQHPCSRKLKKLYSRIRKQMEFYFSDSNLAKDKFLSSLISKDPDGFVNIEIFKKFNKIKALTNSCEVIASSVARSDMFEVSKDHTRVRRTTPIDLSKDFDACTLYVEKLPKNADHKWVKDIFGRLGTVRYVNVPRFKVSNRIKGFAFVEFESPEDVTNACEFYKVLSEKECSASEDENKNIKNAKKHKHEENTNNKKIKKSRTRSISESSDKLAYSPIKSNQQQEGSDKDLDNGKDNSHQKIKRKRKRADSDSEIIIKRSKESDVEDSCVSTTKSNNEPKSVKNEMNSLNSKEQVVIKDENMTEVSNNHVDDIKMEDSKTKRKRKKKHHSNVEKPALRVMRKSEWKAYRNKYLELQRTTMSLLKKQILLETQELKEQEVNVKTVDVHEAKKSLQFLPGVIIKVELSEPVKNPSEIKNQVKANAVVAYIDAPVDTNEIYIRCLTPEEAQVIVKEEKLHHLGKAELLQGDEEKKYWEKIETDRKNKFDNPVPHKKRGREKILAKAAKLEEMKNKHVYFDE